MQNHNNPLLEKIAALIERINTVSIFNRTFDKKTIIIAFSVLIAVIAAISGLFVVGEIKNDDTQSTTLANTTTDIPVSAIQTQQINANFLFVLTDGENVDLLSVVGLNSEDKKIRVAFIDKKSIASAENNTLTLESHYRVGGMNQLVTAVSNYANITIHRYLEGDEAKLKTLIGEMGNFTIDVEEKIVSEHNGISFIIESGTQTMIPDVMSKYFIYLCSDTDKHYVKLANIMMLFGERLFAVEEDEKVEKNLSKLITIYNTNISAVDYSDYKPAIKALAQKDIINSMIIEGSASSMVTTESE